MRLTHLGKILLRGIAWRAFVAALAVIALPLSASAQVPGGFQPFNLSGGAAEPTGPVVKAKGVIVPAAAGKPAQLVVTADIDAGWHIYSTTQPPGGPIRSQIKVPPSADYKLGDFTPTTPPHAEPSTAFTNVIEETHDGSVTWTAPLDLSPGVDPAKLVISGSVFAQACSNTCLPPQDYKFTAQVAGAAPPAPTATAAPSTSTSTSTLPSSGPPLPAAFKPLNLTGGPAEPTGPVVKVTAQIVPGNAEKQTHINVTATLEPKWHIYSITQPPGGPIRTQIKIAPSGDYTIGEFKPTTPPHAEPSKAFTNVVEETHEKSVTWTAPIQLGNGVNSVGLVIEGSVFAQACNDVCLPPQDYKFTAQVGGPSAPTSGAPATAVPAFTTGGPPMPTTNAGGPPLPGGLDKFTQPAGAPPVPTTASPATVVPAPAVLGAQDLQLVYKAGLSHVTWTGSVSGSAESRGKPTLILRATSDPDWHVYAQLDTIPATGNRPTIILFKNTSGLTLSKPTPDVKPTTGHEPGALDYFENTVTWSTEIDVPEFKSGVYRITGSIGFQTCKEKTCDPPKGVNFETEFTIESDDNVIGGPVRFVSPVAYKELEQKQNALSTTAAAAPLTGDPLANIKPRVDENKKQESLVYMLGLAFMAGFILNFMPCVLPVIGLKVLSFVEQAGHDRKKILQLNIWYSVGMLTVFWVLAALASGWGQHFSSATFTITVTTIVFAMALSFLGVWEIPIPGFAGSGGAQKLASKEGFSGAYFKGIITTVLATPCSGPGLAAAVAFALDQSRPVAFAIFTAMGLGMASPYLLIGFQPKLLRFLPKPGDWMDTFKQIMGFVLLGTVVWLMNPLPFSRLIPTITFMFGIWAACWWIGRVPVYAEFSQKAKAWAGAAVWGLAIGWLSFAQLVPVFEYRVQRFVEGEIAKIPTGPTAPSAPKHVSADGLNWQLLSLPQLETAFASNQTVLVDFTADWCATCKLLKSLYLDRPETKKLVEELGVVTFEADMTNPPPELNDLLRKLNPSGGVPVIAIFPAGDPSRPFVFADGYTQSQIFDALRQAGKSKPKTAEAPAAKTNDSAAAGDRVHLPWESVTSKKLEKAIGDGRTVLIDFSADWMPHTRAIRAACLDQPETKAVVEELGITAFEADMSKPTEELQELLKAFNRSQAIPTLVIFSAADPSKPVVIEGHSTKEDVVAVLKKAGPSKTVAATAAPANTTASSKVASPDKLDWKLMTVSRLRAELTDRKTVLINFTSNWCPTCKPLKASCLDQPETKRLVEELDAVSFEADMSYPPEEMWELLQKLNKVKSLPTWVVFSASDPSNPIVIDDGHTKTAILDALRKAGKSLTKTNDGSVGRR